VEREVVERRILGSYPDLREKLAGQSKGKQQIELTRKSLASHQSRIQLQEQEVTAANSPLKLNHLRHNRDLASLEFQLQRQVYTDSHHPLIARQVVVQKEVELR